MTRVLDDDDEPSITDAVAAALRYEGLATETGRAAGLGRASRTSTRAPLAPRAAIGRYRSTETGPKVESAPRRMVKPTG